MKLRSNSFNPLDPFNSFNPFNSFTKVCLLSSALCLSGIVAQAQDSALAEKFQQQLKEIQESFEKAQREMRESFERKLSEQQKEIEALKKQVAGATNAPPPVTSLPPVTGPATGPSSGPALEKSPWSPGAPIRFGSGQNYLNLSFDGLFAAGTSTANDIEKLETGGHDPKQRGFTVENIETTFEGKVDPYFRGQAAVVLQIDPKGESFIELEDRKSTRLNSSHDQISYAVFCLKK